MVQDQVGPITVEQGFKPVDEAAIGDWNAKLEALLAADLDRSFSVDVKLSKVAIAVNRKLDKLRSQMLSEDPVLVTAPHYEKLDSLLLS